MAAPWPLKLARVHRVLAKADLRVKGRPIGSPAARNAIDELTAAGVLEQGPEGVRAPSGWALTLTEQAREDGKLAALCRGVHATRPRNRRYHEPAEDEMQFRWQLVRGEFAHIGEFVDEADLSATWGILAAPLRADIIGALPPSCLGTALTGCLERVMDAAAAPEPVLELCQALTPTPIRHSADFAFIRVLQGRFDEALEVFNALPGKSRIDNMAVAGTAATRAVLALLRGDDEETLRQIEAAMAAAKAGTRRRSVFVESHAFALALLALVRMDTTESLALLERILRAAERNASGRFDAVLTLVDMAARLKAKRETHTYPQTGPRLVGLYDGLHCCWREHFGPAAAYRRDQLARFRQRAAAAGLDWAVAEADEVLRRAAIFEADQAGRRVAAHRENILHAQLGTVTLADVAVPLPDWEFSLKTLERIAHETTGTATAGQSKTKGKQRLAWDLDTTYGTVTLAGREQRQLKSGAWSKGRRVSLRRMAAEAADLSYLAPQDRAALAALSMRRYWGGQEEVYAGAPSLFALAGHPHVFNNGAPVEVVRREVELLVNERQDGVLVSLVPHPGDDEQDYRVLSPSAGRVEVTRFSAAHRRLVEVIPDVGLMLPDGAKGRLLEAVSALAGEIRVHSDTGGAVTATQVQADAEPWVRLEPMDGGLAVALVVEPIAESGNCFPPGAGGATVFASEDGRKVQTERDLAAERAAAARLLETCPALALLPGESEPLLLPEPARCLELLEQLHEAEARCKWPQGQPFKIVGRAAVPALSLKVKSAGEWLQASGGLEVDGERVVGLKRLFALLEASPGSRFLELDKGQFVALESGFRRQLDDLASVTGAGAGGAVRLSPLAALALDDLLDSARVEADRDWQARRAKLKDAQAFDPQVPSTLQAELRPYQVEGYRWLARLAEWGAGACLADDMGLGKTVQTLAVLLRRAPGGPALVVAPTSVVANWLDEARRFAPTLNVKIYVGPGSARTALLQAPAPFDLYVTTYGVAQKDADQLAGVRWHSAVLDEAQAVKNPTAKRSRAVRRLPADFRVITTGTPIQNNLVDLHALFGFANPGLLGSLEQFRRNVQIPIERDGDGEAQARLRRIIAPFVLRRLKAEVLDDLPERTEITLHVPMSAAEAELYEALRQRAVEDLEGARREAPELAEGARRVQILAHLTRLRLACCHPRLAVPEQSDATPVAGVASSKLQTFASTLDELRQNRHKVLVFSQFVRHLKLVEEYLQSAGVAYQYLDGATPRKARAERIAAFQAGQGDVFLISLKAGGVGLNLTAADYVIHMDPWWNPAVEDQASDRAHRIGQTRPVTVYRLVTEGTIEEQIVELHRKKRDLANQLLDGTDATGRLNADELLALLRQPLAS